MKEEKYVDIKEAAKIAGVTERTIRYWIERSVIKKSYKHVSGGSLAIHVELEEIERISRKRAREKLNRKRPGYNKKPKIKYLESLTDLEKRAQDIINKVDVKLQVKPQKSNIIHKFLKYFRLR